MSGWPTRISRYSIGPIKDNLRPVRDPLTEVGGTEINTAWWALAGMAATASTAWLEATFTGPATIAITAHREAWDPFSTGVLGPSIVRSGVGVYVVTYAATYLDDQDIAVATQLYAPDPKPINALNYNAVAEIASGRIVTVRIFEAHTNVPRDSSFSLRVH